MWLHLNYWQEFHAPVVSHNQCILQFSCWQEFKKNLLYVWRPCYWNASLKFREWTQSAKYSLEYLNKQNCIFHYWNAVLHSTVLFRPDPISLKLMRRKIAILVYLPQQLFKNSCNHLYLFYNHHKCGLVSSLICF